MHRLGDFMIECIIIQQWVFAVVGIFGILISSKIACREWRKYPHENEVIMVSSAISILFGLILIICGIYPYIHIPCIVVIP